MHKSMFGHISVEPGFKPQCVYVRRVFHLSRLLISLPWAYQRRSNFNAAMQIPKFWVRIWLMPVFVGFISPGIPLSVICPTFDKRRI